ncbi:MAG TPA: general stress protein [Stellaceae bacterium]|nr:general stress protein [Stellaceae bacterium]
MLQSESVIAVFGEHQEADAAVKKLMNAGIMLENLSIVGKGYHSEEKIVGFYNIGDRIKFWGKRGALWGSLWGLFVGGVSLTIPGLGPIMVLGYLATIIVSAVEGAIMGGGLSMLGAALYSAGVPRGSIVQYEQAVKADGFLVIVHAALEELARARAILALGNPSRLDLHDGLTTSLSGPLPVDSPQSLPGPRLAAVGIARQAGGSGRLPARARH